ncbi:MAG: phosphoribosylglycinamide formyltransferase [Acidobacteriota bacterium]|nr:phosphoribosylglycinamide formyltransferase [Acidobacteriota bacterium]
MTRLGILLSGRGSNFEAIANAIAEGTLDAEIAVVISNRAGAPGLEAARKRGLAALAIPAEGREREAYDGVVVGVLREHGVELVCLAGYMRLLSRVFIDAFPGRILNIHPSLLPAFPGMDAQKQALDRGVKIAGCTVHLVNEQMDAGPILLQAAVPVETGDTVETLSARILREEHRLYPEAVRMVISGTRPGVKIQPQ